MDPIELKEKNKKNRESSIRWRKNNLHKARELDREYKKRKRAANRDSYNASIRKYRAKTPEIKIRTLLSVAKARAKLKGLPFDISIFDIEIPTHCPLLGIKLTYAASGHNNAADGVSLDRIEPEKGYVAGNVWVISHRANRIKNDATAEELRMIADNLGARIGCHD
jgi:hypothetical protein